MFFFFFNDTATTEIYTLSLHDALPISGHDAARLIFCGKAQLKPARPSCGYREMVARSEEHTSELQSRLHLVCRLLLEKKKKKKQIAWPVPCVLLLSSVLSALRHHPSSS